MPSGILCKIWLVGSFLLSVGCYQMVVAEAPQMAEPIQPPAEGMVYLTSIKYLVNGDGRVLSLWQDLRASPPPANRRDQPRGGHRDLRRNRLVAIDAPERSPTKGMIVWFGLSSGREISFERFYRIEYGLVRISGARTFVVKMLGDMPGASYEIFEIDTDDAGAFDTRRSLEEQLDWSDAARTPVAAYRQFGGICLRDRLEIKADPGGMALTALGEAPSPAEPCPQLRTYFDLATGYLFDLHALGTYDDRGGLHPLEAGAHGLRLWLDRRGDPRVAPYEDPVQRLQKARELGLLIPATHRLLLSDGLVGPPGEGSVVWMGGTTVSYNFHQIAGRVVQLGQRRSTLVAIMYAGPSVVQFKVFLALDEVGEKRPLGLPLNATLPWAAAPTEPWTSHRPPPVRGCERDRLDVEVEAGALLLVARRHSGDEDCPPVRSRMDLETLEWTDLPANGRGAQ